LLPQIHLSLAKLCRIVSLRFTHLEKCVLECPADLLFRCPAGPWAWRIRRQAVRVTEYGGAVGYGALYMILRSSSERLRRLRQVNDHLTMCVFVESPSAMFLRERNPRFRSSRVSLRCYHLVEFSWLVYVHA
jgi:hypothetical protein